MPSLLLLKLILKNMASFYGQAGFRGRPSYPAVLDQDRMPLTGAEHSMGSQRRRKSGAPHHPHSSSILYYQMSFSSLGLV